MAFKSEYHYMIRIVLLFDGHYSGSSDTMSVHVTVILSLQVWEPHSGSSWDLTAIILSFALLPLWPDNCSLHHYKRADDQAHTFSGEASVRSRFPLQQWTKLAQRWMELVVQLAHLTLEPSLIRSFAWLRGTRVWTQGIKVETKKWHQFLDFELTDWETVWFYDTAVHTANSISPWIPRLHT